MKKLFSVLAIVALVSCNSNDDKTEVKPADSSAITAPAPVGADTAAKAAPADTSSVAK